MHKELGQYRILERLGSGAMGEVYVAEDTKLGRKVAIKMLPPEVADSPERRKNLEREAQVVAALNHPNIVTVHSVEEAEGSHFITMELVEGTTLRASLPTVTRKRFFEIAVALADAIGTAHRHGMIHRDLKPENIMISDEGRAKVLDFGLAKFTEGVGESSISEMATRSKTEEGLIVGTIAYMSPEQAEGKAVDERSDIFALGIIFYEMLAKRHPFPGDTAAAMLSSILRETPASLGSLVPDELARIVHRCLEKEPGRRYQSAIDLRNDLEELHADVTSGALAARAAPPPEARWKKLVPWGIAALAVVVALAPRAGDVPESAVRRHVFQPPPSTPIRGVTKLSADGSRLYFRSGEGRERRLYVRPLDELSGHPVPGTDGAYDVAFSPDGAWLAFAASGTLSKLPVSGGEPTPLSDIGTLMGLDWGDDDALVFGGVNLGLWRVSAEGGVAEELFAPETDDGELDVHDTNVLTGSRAVVYTLHRRDGGARIEAYLADTGERRVLVDDAFTPRYLPTGHLVYGTAASSLFAVPFDAARVAITGPPVRVVDGVRTWLPDVYIHFTVGADGTLAYEPDVSLDGRRLVWVDGAGNEELVDVEPRAYADPRLSPDGSRLAVGIRSGETQDIWIYDLANDTRQRVTLQGFNEAPVWSPDGASITFTSDRDGPRNLFRKAADGSGEAERLYGDELRQMARAWAPDGSALVFDEALPTDIFRIRILRPGHDPPVESFEALRERQKWARFSRDGRLLAYTDGSEVFVRPWPGPGGGRQISTAGGSRPVWSWDGATLFFRRGGQMVGVAIETGRERVLFEGDYVQDRYDASFDVAPDGRFLMIKPSDDELAETSLVIVENWFTELRRRVPPP